MKRFQFISRLATSVAAVALTIGTAVTISSCSDDDDQVNNQPAIVRLNAPAGAAVSVAGADLTATWEKVEGAANYAAQIRHSKYGDVIAEVITELTQVTFADLDNGDYVFRVRANDANVEGRNSDWSEWTDVIAVAVDPEFMPLDTPKDPVCVEGKTTASSLTFAWEVVEHAENYTFKLANALGETVKEDIVEELTATIPNLEAGVTYTFMVKANPAADTDCYRSSSYSKSITGTTVGQLATPAQPEVALRMAEALSFRWAEVEHAAGYVYELYEGQQTSEPLVTASTLEPLAGSDIQAETTNSTASFMGLKKDTYYSFRIKAVAAEGANFIESAFTDYVITKTLVTDATPLVAPSVSIDASYTKVTVSWGAVTGAASYKVQLGASMEEAEASEPVIIEADELGALATEYVKSGLEAATAYYVRVMACADPEDTTKIDSEYSAWKNFTTLAKVDAITISTADELLSVFDCVNPGAVITLKAGNYSLTTRKEDGTYEARSFTIPAGVTIKGESADNRPVVNHKTITLNLASNPDLIRLENLELTGYKPGADGSIPAAAFSQTTDNTAGGYAFDSNNAGVLTNLEIVNCSVHGFNNSFLRMDRGANVTNILLENCFISVGGDNGQLVGAQKNTAAMNVTVKNCTIDHLGSAFGGQAVRKSKNAAIVRLAAVAGTKVLFENNTFYNLAGCNSKTFVENKSGETTFKNNIIVFDEKIAFSGALSNGTVLAEGTNLLYNTTGTYEIEGITIADPAISAYVWKSNYAATAAEAAGVGSASTSWK